MTNKHLSLKRLKKVLRRRKIAAHIRRVGIKNYYKEKFLAEMQKHPPILVQEKDNASKNKKD